MRRWALVLLAGSALLAQDTDKGPTARLGFGAFTDQFSDATGTRKGWLVNGEWFRDNTGPWTASVVGTTRPEGTGTSFSLGKEIFFGDQSWAWLSLGKGTGADFVPTLRGSLDLTLGFDATWSLGLAASVNRYQEDATTTVLQAGPGWARGEWSTTLRLQQVRYTPGSESDTGGLLDLRWGASNKSRWHSLRVGVGAGILDAMQAGGGFSSSTMSTTGGGRGSGNGRSGTTTTTSTTTTTTVWVYPSLKETLISTTHHFPLTKNLALRADLAWGRRETAFTLWSATLQTFISF